MDDSKIKLGAYGFLVIAFSVRLLDNIDIKGTTSNIGDNILDPCLQGRPARMPQTGKARRRSAAKYKFVSSDVCLSLQ